MDSVCAQTPGRDAKVADILEERGARGRSLLRMALAQALEYTLNDLQLAQRYRIRAGLEDDPLKED